MTEVNVDNEKKLVTLTLNGLVNRDEISRAAEKLKNTLIQFKPQEAVLLIDLTGFLPASNDVLQVLRGMGRDVLNGFRKAALVQDVLLQYGGGRKAMEPPPGYKLPSYHSMEKAIHYLLEE